MYKLPAEQQLFVTRARMQTRRHFFANCGIGLGTIALHQLAGGFAEASAGAGGTAARSNRKRPAKNVIYLHMAGSPPQQELLDYKPKLEKHHLEPCPNE
ncbi:MAG: DUF1501 domain-containing protein, partial [Bythopirellula sp.]